MSAAARMARAYVRGHGIDIALAGAVAICIVLATTHRAVSLPSLRAVEPVQVSLDLLLPGIAAVLVCVATREPVPTVAVTSTRGRSPARLARIVTVTGLALLPALLLADSPELIVSRFLFLTAVGLIGVRLLGGDAAWLAPTAYLVAATLVGNNRDGTFESWAWVLSADQSWTSAALAAVFFIGAAVWWARQSSHRDLW